MGKDYYVGLDSGTGSLGWSVTNETYEIQRSHGKALWGVRLFDAAETAEERRGFRTNRRRLDRRNWRLELLQEIFGNEKINQVDDGFFLRMKESRYLPEDKRGKDGNCRSFHMLYLQIMIIQTRIIISSFRQFIICENGLWKRQIPPIFDWSIWRCIIW